MIRKLSALFFLFIFVGCNKPKESLPQYKSTITNSIGMTLNYIPAGTFMMGPKNEFKYGIPGEVTVQHKVSLTNGFYMQTTETTVGQWRQFINATDYKTQAEKDGYSVLINFLNKKKINGLNWYNPGFEYNENYPVTMVSWEDTIAFIKWLNKKSGQYRLPTEAEWEYACRAGSTKHFFFGDLEKKDNKIDTNEKSNLELAKYAWYDFNSGGKIHEVYLKEKNPWGLHGMYGNVSEYCSDFFRNTFDEHEINPNYYKKTFGKVVRGGNWYTTPIMSTSSCRNWVDLNYTCNFYGFRVVKELDEGDLIKTR